jgi:hypothetical protein
MTTDNVVLFAGCAAVSVLCGMLIVVFRYRPQKLDEAIKAGQSDEHVERQVETLRRVRMAGWRGLIVGVCGMAFAVIRK